MPQEKPESVPSGQPLDGMTTTEDMRFESNRLSYESARTLAVQASQKIGTEVQERGLKDNTVVVVDVGMFADFTNLAAALADIRQITADYATLSHRAVGLVKRRSESQQEREKQFVIAPEGAVIAKAMGTVASTAVEEIGLLSDTIPVVSAVTSLASAGIGLLSLFRQDVAYKGSETSVDALSFKIALASRLVPKVREVHIAELFVPPPADGHVSGLESAISALQKAKAAAWKIVSPFMSQIVMLDAQIDEAVGLRNQEWLDSLTRQASELRRDVQPFFDSLSSIDSRMSGLETGWQQAESSSNLTFLGRLLRAEAIHGLEPIYVHCEIVSSGGHSRTVRNLWRTLFGRDGLSFMGGVVARWVLLSSSGALLAGDIETQSETRHQVGLQED